MNLYFNFFSFLFLEKINSISPGIWNIPHLNPPRGDKVGQQAGQQAGHCPVPPGERVHDEVGGVALGEDIGVVEAVEGARRVAVQRGGVHPSDPDRLVAKEGVEAAVLLHHGASRDEVELGEKN